MQLKYNNTTKITFQLYFCLYFRISTKTMFGSLVKLFISNGFLTLCLLFLVLITIALYVHLTYYKHSERFMELANKIPGPMTFPFIGSAYIFGTNPRGKLNNLKKCN